MSKLLVDCEDGCVAPGEVLWGTVIWDCEKAPRHIDLTLQWRTEGLGTTDKGSCAEVRIPCEGQVSGEGDFRLRVPLQIPPSYSGRLVSICWELLARANISWAADPQASRKLTVSASGEPLCPPLQFPPDPIEEVG